MSQTAHQILREAADAIEQRAALRDLPKGERSMSRAVAIFAAATGRQLSELEGWTFMICLKLARANAGANHLDDYTDLAGYAALAGECLHQADSLPAAIATPAAEPSQEQGEDVVTVAPTPDTDSFFAYCMQNSASRARAGGDDCYQVRSNSALAHAVLNELLKASSVNWCRHNVFFDGLFLSFYLSPDSASRGAEIDIYNDDRAGQIDIYHALVARAKAAMSCATEAVAG